ncbi:TA system VapC family ribonuclease toxin [uncultured Paludibaculum sp.]|uniref:TA system VapC family ribonuclease toxin n=1 Tax=uncultured Paludibaculum sp. TaxID=1765020 RepID=UPI002AAA7D8F|nr:TA system VapC family ribonuclease toxin [uncultured Paludibaculum sp.]
MKTASSELLLLDVNVLLAIAWPNHQFHSAAIAALSRRNRWATCALTQLGFIRLSSNPAVVGAAKGPQQAVALLADLVGDPLHVYLDSLPAPTSGEWRSAFAGLFGHQQVTDAYLLQLAATHNAVLLTFDRRLESLSSSAARVVILG